MRARGHAIGTHGIRARSHRWHKCVKTFTWCWSTLFCCRNCIRWASKFCGDKKNKTGILGKRVQQEFPFYYFSEHISGRQPCSFHALERPKPQHAGTRAQHRPGKFPRRGSCTYSKRGHIRTQRDTMDTGIALQGCYKREVFPHVDLHNAASSKSCNNRIRLITSGNELEDYREKKKHSRTQ